MDYFAAGLDVSLETVSICIVDAAGDILLEKKIEAEPAAIIAVLKHFSRPRKRIGLEAGPTSSWLYSELRGVGYPAICRAPARPMPGRGNRFVSRRRSRPPARSRGRQRHGASGPQDSPPAHAAHRQDRSSRAHPFSAPARDDPRCAAPAARDRRGSHPRRGFLCKEECQIAGPRCPHRSARGSSWRGSRSAWLGTGSRDARACAAARTVRQGIGAGSSVPSPSAGIQLQGNRGAASRRVAQANSSLLSREAVRTTPPRGSPPRETTQGPGQSLHVRPQSRTPPRCPASWPRSD